MTEEKEKEIETLLNSYGTALNSSNAGAILDLYGSAPVVIQQNSQAVVGRDAVRKSLDQALKTLKFDYAINIDEVEISGDVAWARTTATNRIRNLATGKQAEFGVNQVWVFRSESGAWKIHLYFYSASSPTTAS